MKKASSNEWVTVNIIRKRLETSGAIADGSDPKDQGQIKARYWEQTPNNHQIRDLLKNASKSLTSPYKGKKPRPGRPEFVVAFDEHPDFLIVVECKASIQDHQGQDPKAYAESGALHYAAHLSKELNILAIAVSGTEESLLRISHFWHFKGDTQPVECFGNEFLHLDDYLEGYLSNSKVMRQDLERMLLFAKKLNIRLHSLAIREANRSLLLSAILIALKDAGFKKGYLSRPTPKILLQDIKNTMLSEMKRVNLPSGTLNAVESSYGFMDGSSRLITDRNLVSLVSDIEREFTSFRRTHEYHDLLGQLYVEFLRYSNSDKGLGIVLTPPHITELAVGLADVGSDDVLYDNCAGTGGFLVSGMKQMIEAAKGNRIKEDKIKAKGLVGVELQHDIVALLSSNMFIHGDGRSNVFQGDCFVNSVCKKVSAEFRPTVGLLNPPFKNSTKDRDEMEFIINNLEALESGGRCVALIPMQCALATTGERLALKRRLLESHTLEAVLSLPDQLFHNSKASAVTCLAQFTAHKPHPSRKKTWFARCKDDGFIIKKPFGRCDPFGEWENTLPKWIRLFRNRESIPGFSTMREVTARSEWCAERYIDADYSEMANIWIPSAVQGYVTSKADREIALHLSDQKVGERNPPEYTLTSRPASVDKIELPPLDQWGAFTVGKLFRVSGTKTTPLEVLKEAGLGDYPYITTQATNNGAAGYFNQYTEKGGVITVDSAVLGFASYQPDSFSASDHVEKLSPKFRMDQYLAMFFTAALNANQFRYSYGRKASQTRLRPMMLKLPVSSDGEPDYDLMRRYVQTLPFSSKL